MNSQLVIPNFEDLRQEFDWLKEQQLGGVAGAVVFDSGIEGPCLGVTIMTHGNEPSGLACLWHFRRAGELQNKLRRGKVIFTLNNLLAAEKYFAARLAGEKSLTKYRFVDHNLNRLPKDCLSQKDSQVYEVRRVQELRPIWSQFDYGLDIHSTTLDSQPMLVTLSGLHKELIKKFPIEIILSNFDKVQIALAAASLYGREPGQAPAMAVETGQHEKLEAFEVGIICVNELLKNINLADSKVEILPKTKKYKLYESAGSLVPANSTYRLTKVFPSFEFVKKDTVLADGDQGPVTMPFDGHVIFGPATTEIKDLNEETLFMTLPVREIEA